MIPEVRAAYNKSFSESKYAAFLAELDALYNYKITFRVAETPLFVGHDFKKKLIQASDDIIDFLVRKDVKELTAPALPPELNVPNETDHTLFLALDFAVVKYGNELEPRLIEMQGFPSLYGWQDLISQKYREHFDIPDRLQSHFGFSSEEYREKIRKVLLNGHDSENVILLEIDPLKQNTAIDFLVTKDFTGIEPVHIGDVIREGRKLFYIKDGRRIAIKRIYNRVIFDELVKRPDLQLSFKMTDDVDVEWAGHPNWFYRISKYTMPLIKSKYIPECKFLSDYKEFPKDLENYVLKPLFSFSGSGVIFHVTADDLKTIPENQRHEFMLQRKVEYEPVLQAPDGMVKIEIRLLFIWEDGQPRPQLITNLARLSRGEMIGVKYNKDKTWVGGSVAFFED
ncbi:MAG: hypothetical protein HOP08_11270 [Cyclobacteriaceae bacterium]|nr:hypothetical protein [Cyclobacteriaceae bacterium]